MNLKCFLLIVTLSNIYCYNSNTQTEEENITASDAPECNVSDNNTEHTFENECSNEFQLSSDMTANNNDSIIELNGNSSVEREHPERIRSPEDSDTDDVLTTVTSSF